ncbi:MAG: DUF4124 domain-containing protein [Pseudomonadota bacterium]
MKSTITEFFILPATIALLIGASLGVSKADVYKWVDENGDVQFSDRIPAEESKRGHDVLNEQGIVVESVDSEKTPEEIRQAAEQARLAEIKRQEAEKQAAHDKALLKSFTSIDELVNAHEERMGLINQSIFVSKDRIYKQQLELTKLKQRRQGFLDRGMEAPSWLDENEFLVLEKIAIMEEYIRGREEEKKTLTAAFQKDYDRYKEISQRAFSSR